MIVNIIIITIFVLILLISIAIIDDFATSIVICILSLVGIILGVYNIDSDIPPIEVYRNNTELEITYKNNIPIDTVVIWKEQ